MADPLAGLTYRERATLFTGPVSQSEIADLTVTGNYDFVNLPRSVWIEAANAGDTIEFRLEGDSHFQIRAIPSNGWYPWRVAQIKIGTNTTVTKVIGEW